MGRGSIRIITHRKLNLTEQEFQAYNGLLDRHGEAINYFLNQCAEFDVEGNIVEIGVAEEMPMELLYYLQVVSINQRLRKIDGMSEAFDRKMSQLDELVKKLSA